MAPTVVPTSQVWRAAATILGQGRGNFRDPFPVERHLHNHLAGELHSRSSEIKFDCRVSANIGNEVWRKLVFNCVVNPITTIARGEVGQIVDPDLSRLKQLVIEECVAVAASEGVLLEMDLMAEINAAYSGSRNIVSMQQDLLRGRTTEIDYLNGAVVALGARKGLPCPVNEGLTRIIKGMEAISHRVGSRKFAGGSVPETGNDRKRFEKLVAATAHSIKK